MFNKFLLSLLLISVTLFAGNSFIATNGGLAFGVTDPSTNTSFRIETQLHGITLPGSAGKVFDFAGTGFAITINANGQVGWDSYHDNLGGGTCNTTITGMTNALLRFQRDTANQILICEAWNYDGTLYNSSQVAIPGPRSWTFSGAGIGSGGTADIGFLRIWSTLVAAGSKPPTTANSGDLLELKFDVFPLIDSSGHQTVSCLGGGGGCPGSSAILTPTPNQVAVSLPKTANTPNWTNWISLRAGVNNQLDGNNSYSLADSSDVVSCFWQELSGPTIVNWISTHASCIPTFTGTVTGTYNWQLTATDVNNSIATASLQSGVVSTDSNYSVIYPDSRLDKILGPQIAFGHNPWEWFDYRNLANYHVFADQYEVNGGTWRSEWNQTAVKTYYASPFSAFSGTIYFPPGGGLSPSTTESDVYGNFISITNINHLFVLAKNGISGGNAWTLTFRKNGVDTAVTCTVDVNSGFSGAFPSCSDNTHNFTFTSTDNIDIKLTTTGTPPSVSFDITFGDAIPRNGTVFATNSTSVINGIGTNFKDVFCGGTTKGNAFMAVVPLVPLGGSQAPQVYNRPIDICTSNTLASFDSGFGWDLATINSPGVPWGTFRGCYDCGVWVGSGNNPSGSNLNFYDSAMGHYALYYRSGWTPAQTSASWLADRWYWGPAASTSGAVPRDQSMAGSIIHALFDTPTYDMWPTLRHNAAQFGLGGVPGDPISDVREQAYGMINYAWLGLFDPDPTNKTNALNTVVTGANLWLPDQQPNGNFINNEFEGDTGHAFQVTQGSDVATVVFGGTVNSNYCGGISTNTGTIALGVDRNSLVGTGTNFVGTAGQYIMLSGTLNGQPWSMDTIICPQGGAATTACASAPAPTSTTLYMADPWRGDIGGMSSTRWQIMSSPPPANIYYESFFAKTDINNVLVQPFVIDTDNWYWCTYTDPTHIRLSTVYTADTSGGNIYRRPTWQNLTGRGSQPYQVGIVTMDLRASAESLTSFSPSLSTQLRTAVNNQASWLPLYGTSPATKGLYYGAANFSNCQNLGTYFGALECAQAYNGIGVSSNSSNERSYIPEAMNAYVWQYLSTLNPSVKTTGDTNYTAQWSYPGFAAPFPGDGNFAQLADATAITTKAYGQVYGQGQGAQWPSARNGGVTPPDLVSFTRSFSLAAVLHAVSVNMRIKQPSGVETVTNCTVSPCSLTADRREGSVYIQTDYLNGSSQVIASGSPVRYTFQ